MAVACELAIHAQESLQERIDSALFYDSHADFCADAGRFQEARDNYKKAYRCYPPGLDDINPLARPALCQKTASMMIALAEYGEAQEYLDMADSLLSSAGRTDAHFAAALKDTRASLKSCLGDVSGALALWQDALALIEYGTRDYTVITENIADMLIDNGAYSEAINILSINALTPSSQTTDSINVNRKIAKALALQGRPQTAEVYLKKAEKGTSGNFSSDDYMIASQDETAAFVHETSGRFAEAYNEYSKAYGVFARLLGEEHPNSISCKMGMSKSALMAGRYKFAWKDYMDYLAAKQKYLASEMSRMNHREMVSYWSRSNEGYIDAPLFCLKTGVGRGPETAAVLNAAMFAKSVTLDMSLNFKEAVDRSSDNRLKTFYRQMKDCLAGIQALLPMPRDYGKKDSLRAEAERTERMLRSGLYKEGLLRDSLAYPDWRLTADALDDEAVAIEFADFTDGGTRKYCAFVYRKSDDYPAFVPLCTENELAAVCGIDITYTKEAVESRFSEENLGKLYEIVWKPLEENFGMDKDIYFAPAGLLNNLPLEYIGAGPGGMAIDRCRKMRRVSVTKDIPYLRDAEKFDKAVLYGDINYYSDNASRFSANAFCPLPGSRRELASIKSLLGRKIQVRERIKKDATEADFKNLVFPPEGHALLHLSTHGFYFPAELARSQYYYMRYSREDLVNLPMLRSAIAMSGANLVWTGMKQADELEEDGILTAQEISGLDLKGVSLVVLSACQSGLGDIGSEGVHGMRRAFRIAGAENMLVSLWPADDNGTAFLMERFYSAIAEGADAHEALKNAVHDVKCNPAFSSPYYWAAFVIVD